MTENELKSLGFKKEKVTAEESGDIPFYYYVLTFGEYFSLISNSSDELNNDENWYIEIFDYTEFRWYDFNEAKLFIDNLNKNKYDKKI